jgi:hypothetical protein
VYCFPDGAATEDFIANVAGDGETAASARFHGPARFGGVLVFVSIDNGHVGAFLGEGQGGGRRRASRPGWRRWCWAGRSGRRGEAFWGTLGLS